MKDALALQTYAEEETVRLGAQAGLGAAPGLLFCLRGELGAGKTVFVRGLAQGLLAGEAHAVASPTYVLLHVHRGPRRTLYHLDAYRLKGGKEEFETSGLGEVLADPAGVVCVEWPERIEGALPPDRVEVEIEHQGPRQRGILVRGTGPRSLQAVAELAKWVESGASRSMVSGTGGARA